MAQTASVPNYLSSLALNRAKWRIENPPNNKYYEHHVGSWTATLLKNVFTNDPWLLTSEKADEHSFKKPDFVIEKALSNEESHMHLICEIKKYGGDRMEKALDQAVNHIAETIDDLGNNNNNKFEVFILVQRGLDIGFFEYHNDISNLDEEGIGHFRGCVSLTQNQPTGHAVIDENTPDLKPLFFDSGKLRTEKLTNEDEQNIRDEAMEYNIPCIFNINHHHNEINHLIHHILTNEPRSSVP